MIKRIWLCITATILALVFTVAYASGLFPGVDELFGVSMPSVGLAIGREADALEEKENESRETYLNFGSEDYLTFGKYLAGIGAKITDYSMKNSTITAAITARGASMTFSFNWAEKTAVVIYPSGTRAETEMKSVNPRDSILPPVGGVMPSAEFAINRKPDEQTIGDEGLTLIWNKFSDEDYAAFNTYLAKTGVELKNIKIDTGILNAELGLSDFSFHFIYNWNAQTASIIYPDGTTPETSRWNNSVGRGAVLPEVSCLGKELPRISMALKREPSFEETLQDDSLQETYLNFSEADYNAFSQYLQKTGCTLEDYYIDDNGVLVINISNGSGKMIFSYDAVRYIGTVTYPVQTRIEKAWTTTLTPIPKATAKPTEKPVTVTYSANDCWKTAQTYFENLRWKNPDSLVIHGHTTSYTDDGYLFTIDYSAQNGFGGTNRGYYWIIVDSFTNRVTSAIGSE